MSRAKKAATFNLRRRFDHRQFSAVCAWARQCCNCWHVKHCYLSSINDGVEEHGGVLFHVSDVAFVVRAVSTAFSVDMLFCSSTTVVVHDRTRDKLHLHSRPLPASLLPRKSSSFTGHSLSACASRQLHSKYTGSRV